MSSWLFLILLPAVCVAQNTLTVAAAADLTNLEPELARSFGKIPIKWVTSASGGLAQQIENGAPYDVFLSANSDFVDKLAASRKVLPESVIVYAVGRVGVLWKDGKKHPIEDLTRSEIRFVALPNPKLAPYGAAAQAALQHAGIWEKVQPKVVFGENVRQTLQIFESGNADVVLTSDSLLLGKNADVLPSAWHKPIRQKGAAVASTAQLDGAKQFLAFLQSPAGQAIFAKYGFGKPD